MSNSPTSFDIRRPIITPTSITLSVKCLALLHGHISPKSNKAASLLMFDVQSDTKNLEYVHLKLVFQAIDPKESDPEIWDFMPTEARKTEIFSSEATEIEVKKIASNSIKWIARGENFRKLMKPTVLLRRFGQGEFQMTCSVSATAARMAGLRRTTPLKSEDISLTFNPTMALPRAEKWPTASDNLRGFMQASKTADYNPASTLLNMDDESRHCLMLMYDPDDQQHLYISKLEEDLMVGSGEWFLQSLPFRSWLAGDADSGTLWIHGMPGVGKTMLAITVMQQVQKTPAVSDPTGKGAVAFYSAGYFNRAAASTRGSYPVIALRSLIHQLVLQRPVLIKHVVEVYKENNQDRMVFLKTKYLFAIFKKMTVDSQLEVVYLVIDGLDECDEDLVGVVKEMMQFSVSRRRIRLIVTSREEPHIAEALGSFPDFEMQANDPHRETDLRRFIRHTLEESPHDEVSRALRERRILERANGSFLWVKLVLEALMRGAELEFLPQLDLKTSFDLALNHRLSTLDDSSREIMESALLLVAISCAPVPLEAFNVLSQSLQTLDLQDYGQAIQQACGEFLEVHNNTMSLRHHSLQEYILSPPLNAKFEYGQVSYVHRDLSEWCLNYICAHIMEDRLTPTLQYAALYWIEHARQSSQTPADVATLYDHSSFFSQDSEIRKRWLSIYWRHKFPMGEDILPSNFTLLHIAVEADYIQLATVLLEQNRVDVNDRDGDGKTALYYAAQYGHTSVAQQLMDAGAEVRILAHDQSSVLGVAAENGRIEMVQLLLKKSGDFEMDILRNASTTIQGLLLEHGRLTKNFQSENVSVDRKFWGKIIDVGHTSTHNSHSVQVNQLLSPDRSLDDIVAEKLSNPIPSKDRLARWIHLPENNMQWVELLMFKVLQCPEAVYKILRPELWSKRTRTMDGPFYSRCLRPVCTDYAHNSVNQSEDEEKRGTDIMLAIPYLHWGTNKERVMLKNFIRSIQASKKNISEHIKGDKLVYEHTDRHWHLLNTYLDLERPLHTRRSLDQFYYFNLAERDMEIRDQDQTISRYYKEIQTQETVEPYEFPILMVDQLWMWVLDDIVITCFPHQWTNDVTFDRYNMTNIVATVERRLMTKESDLQDATSLAQLIANECSGVLFDTGRYRDRWLEVHEIYENAIGDVANEESRLFRMFLESVESSTNWRTKDGSQERYSIKQEIGLLDRIKDIRDELNMIRSIFHTQQSVLEDVMQFPTLKTAISKRLKEVDKIDYHASETLNALQNILDLKQKQANAEEAHFLNLQNIESGKQGQAIMTFTIFTVIFAPMSFLTSFLALQIVDIPELTIGRVLVIIFPIAAFIVLICILVGFGNILKEWWIALRAGMVQSNRVEVMCHSKFR